MFCVSRLFGQQIHAASLFDSICGSFARFHGCYSHAFRFVHSDLLHGIHNMIVHPEKNETSACVADNRKDGQATATESPSLPSSSDLRPPFSRWIDSWSGIQSKNLPRRPPSAVDYKQTDMEEEEDGSGEVDVNSSCTMDRVVEKLWRWGYVDYEGDLEADRPERGSVEDIFYVGEGILPNSSGGLSPELSLGVDGDSRRAVKEDKKTQPSKREIRLPELSLPKQELQRLRRLAFTAKDTTKIGNAGVTQKIVDKIHKKWKTIEAVRLKCKGASAANMRRMHQILEKKTGGLVIWRSGTSVFLYRGAIDEFPSNHSAEKQYKDVHNSSSSMYHEVTNSGNNYLRRDVVCDVPTSVRNKEPAGRIKDGSAPSAAMNCEREIDKLLEGLGPRYMDWPGGEPLPVDADLLPCAASGYNAPFRVLPYGMKSTLGNKEMTALRRFARALPPHFAIGRSRHHEGLALAVIKLWDRSFIAKIALKPGVQTTTSQRIAEDIKVRNLSLN